MNISFDFKKMETLLFNFYNISHIRYSLVDRENNILCASSALSPFCSLINATPEGHARCRENDYFHMCAVAAMDTPTWYTYRCHCGIVNTILPIHWNSEIIGYIFFGQMLDLSDRAEQWENTKHLTRWHQNRNELEKVFFQLPTIDDQMNESCAAILSACSSYIQMEGLLRQSQYTDYERLKLLIDEHYSESFTLDSIAQALSISKTKLCSLAAHENTTVVNLINERRMKAAKSLLKHTAYHIAEISDLVGIKDYNYFSKLFRQSFGESPREYRKRQTDPNEARTRQAHDASA